MSWIDLDDLNSPMRNYDCFVSVWFSDSDYKTLSLPVYPEEVNNSITTNYQNTNIIGRPGTIANYDNTDDIKSSFSIKLHRELPTFNKIKEEKVGDAIDQIVALIEAAQYPKLDCGTKVPITMYKFGDTLMIGKQTSVNVKWWGPLIEGKYMCCDISISITNVPKKILTFDDIRTSNPRGNGLLPGNYENYCSPPSSIDSRWN